MTDIGTGCLRHFILLVEIEAAQINERLNFFIQIYLFIIFLKKSHYIN